MNNKNELKYLKGGRSFYITLIVCMIVFLGAITILILAFNLLIMQHDEKLSGEICTLVSEKMSNSLSILTDSTQEVSSVLSAQDFDSPEEIYEVLKDYEGTKIISVGFIDEDDKLYMSETEEKEFEKWNLLDTAKKADPVSISAPYRSTRIGQPVITLFTDFEYGNSRHGYMFMTYLFSSLQEVAVTQSLTNDIEIWLMDAKSANIIQCVGSDMHASGSWANAYLAMQNINSENKADYDLWYYKMVTGVPSAAVSYKIEDTFYSQFCSSIEHMPGWYVVVRIPSSALSATMKTFRNYVIIFILVLLNIVFILVSLMYISWKRESRMLSQLSINDPLTGVLNRRAFELAAEKMISDSKEAAIMFFDIDYFKQVNDTFGHDTGDKLLVAFSNALKKNFSEIGLVSRYGGDEFVVLAHMDSKEQITELLKQAKDDVHAIKLGDDKEGESETKDFLISFSAGVASYPQDASSLDELQKCADSALYTVKERGRNDYLWYSPSFEE
ncbi:MAG: GGDEF domain-containing protein [Eubacterium sp.]|nr:GGDEF domain-containing protein [Eubacterium sp.]